MLFTAANTIFILLYFSFLPSSHQIPVACYYILEQPPVRDVPVDYCSHVILINSAHISDDGRLELYQKDAEQFAELTEKRRDLKLLVSITSSNPSFTYLVSGLLVESVFSDATADTQRMNRFSSELIQVLTDFGLHGVDIDWEFPEWSRDAKKGDKKRFARFLEILKYHLQPHNLLLSVAVSGPPTISTVAYDVDALTKFADMVQVMNYDFHVFNRYSNPLVGFNAPLHPMKVEISILGKMNSEASMTTWFEMGLPKNITFFGIPTYARAYQLLTHYLHKPYSPAVRSRSELTNYPDICLFTKDPFYTAVWNRHAQAPYLYGSDGLWISYENKLSIFAKVAFARKWSAGGIMVYSIGSDDYEGKCGLGKFPLLSEIAKLAVDC